jgi:hypothetical protein
MVILIYTKIRAQNRNITQGRLRHKSVTPPDCKVLFLHRKLFRRKYGSCTEMKAEHLRKFRKFGVSRLSEMTFSEFSLPLCKVPTQHLRDKINH